LALEEKTDRQAEITGDHPKITDLRHLQKVEYGPRSRKATNRNRRNTYWYFEDCDSSLTTISGHRGPFAEASIWVKTEEGAGLNPEE
jgi:hypothetical protein